MGCKRVVHFVVFVQMVVSLYKVNNANNAKISFSQAESSYKKAKATLANSREWLQLNPLREVVSSGV